MEMPRPAEFDGAPAEQRRSDRRPLQLSVTVRSASHGEVAAELLNLAAGGLLLRTRTSVFSVGCDLRIALPGGATAAARIVWAAGSLHGLSLHTPLGRAAIATALLKAAALPQASSGAQAAPHRPSDVRTTPAGTLTQLQPEVNLTVPVGAALAFWVMVGAVWW